LETESEQFQWQKSYVCLFFLAAECYITHQLMLIIASKELRTDTAPAFKEGKQQEHQPTSDI